MRRTPARWYTAFRKRSASHDNRNNSDGRKRHLEAGRGPTVPRPDAGEVDNPVSRVGKPDMGRLKGVLGEN